MKKNRLHEAEMAVLAILKKGRANATTGGEIATITGYNSRLISSAISNLVIRYGVPIIGVGLVSVVVTISQRPERNY